MSIIKRMKYLIIVLFLVCMVNAAHAEEKKATDISVELEKYSYQIGIGDVLKITTWKEPDLSIEAVRVRSDGKITFPLIDDIQAGGLTTTGLKKTIEEKLKDYVESPNVTITLINPVSQKFYILGEILKTGEYPLVKNLTAMQAFALAGGFTEWASKNKIILHRKNKSKDQTIIIRYNDIIEGDFTKDIQLKADDIIIVP